MQACSQCVVVDDAARRMTAEINFTIFALPWDQLVHSCMAFRLDDGTTDHTLYPNRKTALEYQLRPTAIFHFRNAMGGVNLRDMAIWLGMQREAYSNDRIAWVDPASPDLIISTEAAETMRVMLTGKRRVRGRG
jgi:hypothetical protein